MNYWIAQKYKEGFKFVEHKIINTKLTLLEEHGYFGFSNWPCTSAQSTTYWSVGEMKHKGEKKGPDLFALTDDISNIKTGMLDLVQLINTANFWKSVWQLNK